MSFPNTLHRLNVDSSEIISMLVAQTIQVTLLIAVVWIVTKAFARNRPHLAHALWILVLIKCLVPPLWSSPTSPFSWMSTQAHQPIKTQVVSLDSESAGIASLSVINKHSDVKEAESRLPAQNYNASNEISVSANPIDLKDYLGEATVNQIETSEFRPSVLVNWPQAICTLWMIGVVVGFATVLVRLGLFIRWIRRCEQVDCPPAEMALRELKSKLGVRRNVRLVVLNQSVGPAVLGVFQPTILLPVSVVVGMKQREIEPLLAHELVHIRRGDLFWAMVQALATSLFWFHPLVWIASRLVTLESERSCDEETVASLGCQPAVYAHGLLDVLEQKQKFRNRMRVAPALPGVRPVDITSARLERVMKLGNGSLKRTPAWVWCTMLICGISVLPGAAIVLAQESEVPSSIKQPGLKLPLAKGAREIALPEGAEVTFQQLDFESNGQPLKLSLPLVKLPDASVAPLPQKNQATNSDERKPFERIVIAEQSVPLISSIPYVSRLFKNVSGGTAPTPNSIRQQKLAKQNGTNLKDNFNLQKFDVSDILKDLENDGLDQADSEKFLISNLPVSYPGKNGESSTEHEKEALYRFSNGTEIKLGNREPNIKIAGKSLFVLAEPEEMNTVRELLNSFREHGFEQIQVEVKFVTVMPEDFRKLSVDWSMVDSKIGNAVATIPDAASMSDQATAIKSETLFNGDNDELSQPVRAVSYVQKNPLALYALLDQANTKQLLATLNGFRGTSAIGAPRVMMFDGQTANVSDTAERPFVVGVEKTGSDNFQPTIRTVTEGLTVSLNPTIQRGDSGAGSIKLNSVVNRSVILGVDTADIPSSGSETATIQIPEVKTTRIESAFHVPLEKTVVLSSRIENEKGESETLLVLIDCKVVDALEESKKTEADLELNLETATQEEKNDLVPNADTVDYVVRSTDSDNRVNRSQVLKIDDVQIRIEEGIAFSMTHDSLSISGTNVEFFLADNEADFYITGEQCSMRIYAADDFEYQFSGAAKLLLGAGQSMVADKIKLKSRDSELDVQLFGNAKFQIEKPQHESDDDDQMLEISGDKMAFDGSNLIAIGSGTLRFQTDGDDPLNIKADRILLDAETGEIDTRPKRHGVEAALSGFDAGAAKEQKVEKSKQD